MRKLLLFFASLLFSGIALAQTSPDYTLYPLQCGTATPPSWCAGSDFGAWVNAAYEQLPSTGGKLDVQVPPAGISYTTAISFATAGKPVFLVCEANTGTPGSPTPPPPAFPPAISFSDTSGTALTFDNASSTEHIPAGGITGCAFSGNGGSAIGLAVGNMIGAYGIIVENSSFYGFGGGEVIFGPNTWDTRFVHNHIEKIYSEKCLYATNTTNSGEELVFDHNTFDHCGVGGVTVGGGGLQAHFLSNLFDDSQLVTTGGVVISTGDHFETPSNNIVFPFVSNTGAALSMSGTQYLYDGSCSGTCPSSFVTLSGGSTSLAGLTTTSGVT